jgi:hypothetical protein
VCSLPSFDPQLTGEVGIDASNILDEPLGILDWEELRPLAVRCAAIERALRTAPPD